ncbi:hypothetical protein K461DRAFT_233884 [Myriangium duriaei CBS 260.36]|uniref:DUF1275 domain protein n=1 Tax=Myriangium duriaei CBS 260.36 TaxID=1168546 RepID=A0A9P4IPU8_9PEZI|nr:hypothetical protein K461DRAFT_233884 [Myriangium duriaei CBS 260.36]
MANNDTEHASADGDIEAAPKPPSAPGRRRSILSRNFLLGPVDTKHADLILLSHSLASGMVDAACFSNWSVFAAMQTGNTVLLGLSTATTSDNPHAWTTTLVSIVSFLVGALFTFRLTMFITPQGAKTNRLFLSSLFMAQALLILIPAALIAANIVPHNPGGVTTLARVTDVIENVRIVSLLPPLAFQAGIQIACSRLLGFNELPINVLTSTYCDLMGDTSLLNPHNVKRNRRVFSVLLLFSGAVSAGWLMRSTGGLEAALFVPGGIKFLAAVGAFVFLKKPADQADG